MGKVSFFHNISFINRNFILSSDENSWTNILWMFIIHGIWMTDSFGQEFHQTGPPKKNNFSLGQAQKKKKI
jgi:hypothetical protein